MNEELKLVMINLDDQNYGLLLQSIIKVFPAVEITTLPNVSSSLLGVINFHGNIIPVINLRHLMGLKTKLLTLTDCFIVFDTNSQLFVLPVDAILKVKEVLSNRVIPLKYLASVNNHYLMGAVKKENELIFVLDLEKIVSACNIPLLSDLIETNKNP